MSDFKISSFLRYTHSLSAGKASASSASSVGSKPFLYFPLVVDCLLLHSNKIFNLVIMQ